ncbi:MAG: cellulase family glycosylhydrolase [Pirellulaceae bacterium]
MALDSLPQARGTRTYVDNVAKLKRWDAAGRLARRSSVRLASLCLLLFCCDSPRQAHAFQDDAWPWIKVSADGKRFELEGEGEPFEPWGYNYDHDSEGALLESYWRDEARVRSHLENLANRGANTVRIHLQVSAFLNGPDSINEASVEQLGTLLHDARQVGLRVCLTGLGCYHAREVPAWYDELDRAGRWEAQAFFWRAIARATRDDPTVFCFDLMNEPVVPGAARGPGEWLGPPFGDKSFVQFIALEPEGEHRSELARRWVDLLVDAIREEDSRHLITLGLVPWSLDRPGLTSGFVPEVACRRLDFISVHIYPETGRLDEASETLAGFQMGKPIVVQEFFPLRCGIPEAKEFVRGHRDQVAGWISFHWGQSEAELSETDSLATAILAQWLTEFEQMSPRR